MLIDHVTVPVRDVSAAVRFFTDALGLPLHREPDEVALGTTTLRFVDDPDMTGSMHLAITVPTGSLSAAHTWLRSRVQLLERDGVVEFESAPTWNARSVYFEGPDAQVLELIEHRRLVGSRVDDFGAQHLLRISEVGVGVPDVMAAAASLREAGLDAYGGPPSDGFAAIGDVDGVLILVPEGRPWAPTDDRRASAAAIAIRADVRSTVEVGASRLGPAR